MVKKFSLPILVTLLAICGLSGWSALQANRKQVTKTHDLVLKSSTPGSGDVVHEFSNLVVEWDSQNPVDFSTSFNPSNTPVATLWNTNSDGSAKDQLYSFVFRGAQYWNGNALTLPLDGTTFMMEDGDYIIKIAEEVFKESGKQNYNPATEIHFSYEAEDVPVIVQEMQILSSNPGNGDEISSLKDIVLKFSQPIVTFVADFEGTRGIVTKDEQQVAVVSDIEFGSGADELKAILDKEITEAGTYHVSIAAGIGCVENPNTQEITHLNAAYEFDVTVKESEPVDPTAFDLVLKSALEFDDTRFKNIIIDLPAEGYTVNSSPVKLTNEAGDEISAPVNVNLYNMGGVTTSVFIQTEGVTAAKPGKWTFTLPEGWAVAKDGSKSREFTRTITWTDSSTGPGDYPKATKFTRVGFAQGVQTAVARQDGGGNNLPSVYKYNLAGANIIDLMDGNATGINPTVGSAFIIETDVDDKIEGDCHFTAQLGHYEPTENGGEQWVADRNWMHIHRDYVLDNNGNKINHPYLHIMSYDVPLYDDTDYSIRMTLQDQQGNTKTNPRLKVYMENMETPKFKGYISRYQFSDVQLLSIKPADDGIIESADSKIELTFSAPVNITEASVPQGKYGSPKISEVTHNEDRTVWYLYDASLWAEADGVLCVNVYAKDDEGRVLKGSKGTDANSYFYFEFRCQLDGVNVTIVTPDPSAPQVQLKDFAVKVGNSASPIMTYVTKPYLENEAGEKIASSSMKVENGNVLISLDRTITAAGKYKLVIPPTTFNAGSYENPSYNKYAGFEYTIASQAVVIGKTIQDNAVVGDLGVEAFYLGGDADVREGLSVNLKDADENTIKRNIAVQKFVNNRNKTMLLLDFTTDGNRFGLEDGIGYVVTIPEGAVTLAGSETAYPEMKLNFRGGASATPEYVAFTHEIGGHSAAVSKVAKGETVKVNLTPAAGWKVEKVLFNDQDVTSDVASNEYTTPALDADANLRASFAYDGATVTPTGINDVVTEFNLRAWSQNGTIFVAGLAGGQTVALFSADGMAIASYAIADGVAAGEQIEFRNIANGTYVIVISDGAKREAIKLQNK